MKNNLFNHSEMKKYAKDKAFKLTVPKHDFLKTHAEKVEQGDFKSERSSYLYFYDFLKEILGYDREKNILFEDKEAIGRGKVEFVLKSNDNKFMVIELKDQTTDLDKPQARVNDKRSPVDQAFSYAQHSDPDNPIDWIMVSNFKEFKLYNYDKRSAKCICFTYEDLLNKELFKDFMVSFSRKSHIDKNYPSKILKATLITEQKLESNFYQLFHETRLMLIKELEEVNDLSRADAVHYAQIILNRYMFIAFAEDTGLLKSQISTDTIITPIKKGNIRHRSIWQRLNELFLDINEGNEHKKITPYNGGLFEEDLDFIKIRDKVEDPEIFKDIWQKWDFDKQEENIKKQLGSQIDVVNPIYKNLLIISSFDFSSEVDVNILGHIFENSIGDLEELKEDTKGRRKKEGIFYTPTYITDYICRNTIIPYLSKNGKSNTVEELIGEYWGSEIEELDKKVKDIKIVDPACGSGAFLNKAADVLVEIHQAIHEVIYKDLKETLKPYFDHIGKRREILLDNIYGVDLNEESVEITKLSLFLKVCKKDLKLPNLDNNIKHGNSLITNPEYTETPFNWEEEFSEIFEEGGFDIVIGNPPYVRQERIKEIKPYLKENYKVYTGVADLYVYFFEKGLNILKNKGMFSFICSNKFMRTNYGANLRKLILRNEFKKYVDHASEKVFQEATVHACTIVIKKESPSEESMILFNNSFQIPQNQLDTGYWVFENPKIQNLRKKIDENSIKINEIPDLKIYYGIKTGFNKAFVIDEKIKNILTAQNPKVKEIIKPLLRGKDIKRWKVDYKNIYLILSKSGMELENEYPSLFEFFKNYENNLRKRTDQGKFWYNLRDCVYYDEFERGKIIWADIAPKPSFLIDESGYFLLNTNYMITSINENYNNYYLLALLNSKIVFWVFRQISPQIEGKRYRYFKQYVEKLPIYPATPKEQQPFINKADQMLKLNKKLQDEVNGFKHWIQKEFNVVKFSKKLDKYYELSEDEFIDELRKKKVDTKSRKNREYLEREFNDSLKIINPLLQNIKETDDKIDRMVYELYGLTEEEIELIENNL